MPGQGLSLLNVAPTLPAQLKLLNLAHQPPASPCMRTLVWVSGLTQLLPSLPCRGNRAPVARPRPPVKRKVEKTWDEGEWGVAVALQVCGVLCAAAGRVAASPGVSALWGRWQHEGRRRLVQACTPAATRPA